MPRIPREVEVRPPREERIIIYASRETKRRWQKLAIDAETKNYEEFANRLLDLYELTAQYLGEKKIDDLIRRLQEILGVTVRLRLVG